MRKLVKRLLKKYHYPPEEADCALDIVLKQREEWSDNEDFVVAEPGAPFVKLYPEYAEESLQKAEEDEE